MANLYTSLGIAGRDPQAPFAARAGLPVVTYGGLNDSVGRMANALVALGIAPGERVAVQGEKCLEMLELYLAAVRMGAVFLPMNPAYTPVEAGHILADATPALVVCDAVTAAGLRARAGAALPRIETLEVDGSGSLADLASGCAADFATVERGDDDLAAILYTSGTTGRPKGAMLSHGNLFSNAATLVDCWRFTAADVLVHALPIFHTHGLFVATNVTLAAGSSMVFQARFDAGAVLAALDGASVLMGVPTFYIRLLGQAGLTREAARTMRLFVSGSAPLSADVHRDFAARTGHAILERYGMTETNMNTSNPYDGERRAGTVGFPLPGVSLRITGEGRELAQDEIGMIEVSGPNVFKGYWNLPVKSAEDIRDGWFVTGDLGMVDGDGYVSIVGRGKDLIISGGFNVYPAEIEDAIDALPEVRESAVIGVPHPDLGEGVVAVIAPMTPGWDDGAAVAAALAASLARYKQPRRFVFVDELPRNAMGKIQKAVLRERYADQYASETAIKNLKM